MRISAEGESVSGVDLEPPSARNVSFRGRSSSTSISTSIVNGRRTTVRRAEVALGYTALGPGTATLGPFRVRAGGSESYDLGSVEIVVLPDSASGTREGEEAPPSAASTRPIWLQAVPKQPHRLYPGTPIRVHYVLHTRYPLRSITRSWQSPRHAMVSLAEDPGDPRWEAEDGLFSKAEVLTLEMVPACPGSLLVPFVEVSAVAFARGSPLGSGVRLVSDSARVAVHPIPREGRPENFAGAVGEIALSLEVTAHPGNSAERQVVLTASGEGAPFIDGFPAITVRGPADLEEVDASGEGKRRTWTWLLVPSDSGRVVLGPDSVAWLDPETGTFGQAVFGPSAASVSPSAPSRDAVMPRRDGDDGPSPALLAALLVALAAILAAVMVLRARRSERTASLEDAADPDELLSALEAELSRLVSGERGYVDGRELARMLSLKGVDRITARSVVACWRHAEALVTGSERYMLEDVKGEALAAVERLKELLDTEADLGQGRGEGTCSKPT